jgi:FAD/FMN-containing dehydrogenase
VVVYRKGGEGYEEARRAAIWNGYKPDRFPDVVAVVENADEVVDVVRLARSEGHRIGIRSGGHSWFASGIRDGGLLLDLSALADFELDPVAQTASVAPAARSEIFQQALVERGFYFPVGTCATTGIGGYLLGGGFSWMQRLLGIAAYGLRSLDFVTAEGERIHADDETHSDLLWAARGGGPRFPGVVTRFQVKVQPLPGAMVSARYVFPIGATAEFVDWYAQTLATTPPEVSMFFMGMHSRLVDEYALTFVPLAFADDVPAAEELLAPLERSPLVPRTLLRHPPAPWTFEQGFRLLDLIYPEGLRFHPDSLWLNPEQAGLGEALQGVLEQLPNRPSHVFGAPYGPREHANAAFSKCTTLEAEIYGVSEEPAGDEAARGWVARSVEELLPYSLGSGKTNVADLAGRPQNTLSDESAKRLAEIRARWDPDGLFYSDLGAAKMEER